MERRNVGHDGLHIHESSPDIVSCDMRIVIL